MTVTTVVAVVALGLSGISWLQSRADKAAEESARARAEGAVKQKNSEEHFAKRIALTNMMDVAMSMAVYIVRLEKSEVPDADDLKFINGIADAADLVLKQEGIQTARSTIESSSGYGGAREKTHPFTSVASVYSANQGTLVSARYPVGEHGNFFEAMFFSHLIKITTEEPAIEFEEVRLLYNEGRGRMQRMLQSCGADLELPIDPPQQREEMKTIAWKCYEELKKALINNNIRV